MYEDSILVMFVINDDDVVIVARALPFLGGTWNVSM